MNNFLKDVLKGLQSSPKYLESKYFYDERGDELFRRIMHCEEYYLTRCELEIFKNQSRHIISFLKNIHELDVVELGAGDATKSVHLLKELSAAQFNFTYYPIDISGNVIQSLHQQLPLQIPQLKIHGLNGEYFEMLEKAKQLSQKVKLILFLGSNIGNITLQETEKFLRSLRNQLSHGDFLLIGFDLKKNPHIILNAYNDKQGITRDFNLNLLHRINNELGADFNVNEFQHYPFYDPETGTCKSYLISLKDQKAELGDTTILFNQHEIIHTEISQKYSVQQTDDFAARAGFKIINHFFDNKKWFLDALWQAE